MDHFTYREADGNDIDQLLRLGVEAYGMYAEALTPDNMEKMKSTLRDPARWAALLAASKGFVGMYNERMVGSVFLVSSGGSSELFHKDWSHIRLLAVHPDFQGRGIAKVLVKWCIDRAKADGETVIALHTGEMMEAARHIYEKLGFVVHEEIPRRLGVRYWIYTRQLKP